MKTTVVTTLPVPSTNTRPYFYAWELTNPTPQINEAADKSSASGGYQMPSSEMHDRFPAYEYEVSISFCIYMNILQWMHTCIVYGVYEYDIVDAYMYCGWCI